MHLVGEPALLRRRQVVRLRRLIRPAAATHLVGEVLLRLLVAVLERRQRHHLLAADHEPVARAVVQGLRRRRFRVAGGRPRAVSAAVHCVRAHGAQRVVGGGAEAADELPWEQVAAAAPLLMILRLRIDVHQLVT